MNVDVTLCVPYPGKSPWLSDCLAAIRSQTLQPAELFVVSATPADDLARIAKRYDARVIIHRAGGLSAARNVALAHANGELLATVEHEVVISPEWLVRLVSHFDAPRVGAAMGRLRERNTARVADRWRASHMTQDRGPDRLVNPPPLPATNVVLRTQLVRELGGYNEGDPANGTDCTFADCDLYNRLRGAGYDGVYEPSAGAERLRSDGVASILTTYSTWLQASCGFCGDGSHEAGLRRKLLETVWQLRAALAQDQGNGGAPLAYLTVLALLRTVLADLRIARQRSAADGHRAAAATTATAEAGLRRQLFGIVAARNARLPATLGMHLDALLAPTRNERSWRASTDDEPLPDLLLEVLEAATLALDELHYDLWRDLPAAAGIVSAEWLPDSKGVQADVGPFQGTGQTGVSVASAGTGTGDRFVAAIESWARTRSDEVAAVVLAGSPEFTPGEPAPQLLAITRDSLAPGDASRWQREVAAAVARAGGGEAPPLQHIPVYALGWVTPSAGVLDLRVAGRVIAGDPALLSLLPAVTPSHLPPAEGLWRVAAAAGVLVQVWPVSGRAMLPTQAEIAEYARGVSMASEGLLLARGAYRAHPAARRSGLAADHEGCPDIVTALTAVAAARATFEAAGGGSDYRQLARRAVLEVAQFCGDWLMSWERPGSSLAMLCRMWFAWAGDRVRVPAAALALLAAAPPPQEPSALTQACQLLKSDPSAPASWSTVRNVWLNQLAAAEADGWPLLWQAAPAPGGRR